MQETIVVEKNGKFGPFANGSWYSFSPKFVGSKQLAVGAKLDVDVFVNTTGKKYINKVLSADVVIPKEVPVKEAFKVPPVVAATTDWAAKDRSQLVGGRSHDAAELVSVSLSTGTPLKDVLEMYREALEAVLRIAGEVK